MSENKEIVLDIKVPTEGLYRVALGISEEDWTAINLEIEDFCKKYVEENGGSMDLMVCVKEAVKKYASNETEIAVVSIICSRIYYLKVQDNFNPFFGLLGRLGGH